MRLAAPVSALTTSTLNATAASFTTPSPIVTPAPFNISCDINCAIKIPPATHYYWVKLSISTTITAATEVLVINRKTNTTSTKIISAELPSGFVIPPTNAAGTHYQELTVGNITTQLGYPTLYNSLATGYSWSGVLATTATNGQPTCSTVDGLTSVRTASVLYSILTTKTITTGNFSTTYGSVGPAGTTTYDTMAPVWATVNYGDIPPQPTLPAPDADDPKGYLYTLHSIKTLIHPKAAETDAAWTLCRPMTEINPITAASTALFLTERSTSFEDEDEPQSTANKAESQTSSPKQTTAEQTASPPHPSSSSPASASNDQPAPIKQNTGATSADAPAPSPTTKESLGPPKTTAEPPSTINIPEKPATSADDETVIQPPATVLQPAQPNPLPTSNIPEKSAVLTNDEPAPPATVPIQPAQPTQFPTVNLPTTINGIATSAPAVIIGSETLAIGTTTVIPAAPNTIINNNNQPQPSQPGVPAVALSGASTVHTISAGQTATIGSAAIVASPGAPVQVVPVAPEAAPGAPSVTGAAPGAPAPEPVLVSLDSSSNYVVGSSSSAQTLQPGANTVTFGGGNGAAPASSERVVLTTNTAGSTVAVVGAGAGSTTVALPAPAVTGAPVDAVTLPGQDSGGPVRVSLDASSNYVVDGGQTLRPGTNTVTFGGSGDAPASTEEVVLTTDAAGSTVAVVGGSGPDRTTVALPAQTAAGAVTLPGPNSDAPVRVSVDSAGNYIVDGTQTLRPGTNTVTFDGSGGAASTTEEVVLTTNAAGSTVAVVGTGADKTTVALPAPTAPASVATLLGPGSSGAPVVSLDASGNYIVDGTQTLTPGTNTLTRGDGASASTEEVILTTNAAGSTVAVAGEGADRTTVPLPASTAAGSAVTLLSPDNPTAPLVSLDAAGSYIADGTQTLTPGTNVLTFVSGASTSTQEVILTTNAAGTPVAIVDTPAGRTTVPLSAQTAPASVTTLLGPGASVAAQGAGASTAAAVATTLPDGRVVSLSAAGTTTALVVDRQTLTSGMNTLSGPTGAVVVVTTDAGGRTVVVEGGKTAVVGSGGGAATANGTALASATRSGSTTSAGASRTAGWATSAAATEVSGAARGRGRMGEGVVVVLLGCLVCGWFNF